MRAALILLALACALSGCKREPSFEERYAKASAEITGTAHDIDAQIAATGAPIAAESSAPR